MANNNTKAKQKLLNRKDRSALVAAANPRNRWNTAGKVNRGKKKKVTEAEDKGI